MFLADLLLQVRLDLSILGKPLLLDLRKNQLSIECDFKPAPSRRDQRERFDILFEGFQNLFRQTDGFVLVASLSAVFNFDFHFDLLFRWLVLPPGKAACSRWKRGRYVILSQIGPPLSEYVVQVDVLQAAPNSECHLTKKCQLINI